MEENIRKQIRQIKQNMEDEEFLSKASDEELMGYIFLSEKINRKIKKIEDLAQNEIKIQK